MTEPSCPARRPLRGRPIAWAVAAGAVLAIAGCKGQSAGQSDAPVPVLSGTASDAMLPFDRVTSQPPLDPRALRSAPAAAGDADPADTEAAPEDAPPAEPPAAPARPAE